MVKTLLYADDTTCLIPCPRDVNVQPIVDGFCVLLFNWFNVNCLTLNLKKCNFIFFTASHANTTSVPAVRINNYDIIRVLSTKFLGCIVDQHLNWHDHILYVMKCLSKGFAMLRCVRTSFPTFVKKLIYYAYIYPFLVYCIPVWGHGHVTYLNRLHVLHKKILRSVFNLHYNAHVACFARQHSLLFVQDIYKVRLAKLMFCILNYVALGYCKFQAVFNELCRRERRFSLRLSDYKFPVIYVRTEIRKRSVFVAGMSFWNDLPMYIRCQPNINKFSFELRTMLINLYH